MGLKTIGGEIRAQPLNENFQYLDGKLLFGPESNRPNPGVVNRLYVTLDTGIVYADTGTEWKQVGGISQIDWANIIGKPSTFPPSPHASEHAVGGSDPIKPEDIGAVKKSGDTMTGGLTIPSILIKGALPFVDLWDSDNNKRFRIVPNESQDALVLQEVDTNGNWIKNILTISRSGFISGLLQVKNPNSGRQLAAYDWVDISSEASGAVLIAQNAFVGQSDGKFKYSNNHASLGARGIFFNWGGSNKGIYYFDQGDVATTANAEFTPNFQPIWHGGNSGPFYKGTGSPEGVVAAWPGSLYQNLNGGQGTTLYYKASGTGNTGWRAIA